MLLLTLRGTPFFYAGDELGMEQVSIPPDQVQDPFEKLVGGYGLGRDAQRTPMRWDATSRGGFTTGEPWLPIGQDVAEKNVEVLKKDYRSLPWLYRRLIELRHAEPALSNGEYQPLRSRNDILLYKRAQAGDEFLIALNTVHQPRKLDWEGEGQVLLSTYLDDDGGQTAGPRLLRPDEGIIIKLGV